MAHIMRCNKNKKIKTINQMETIGRHQRRIRLSKIVELWREKRMEKETNTVSNIKKHQIKPKHTINIQIA